MLSWRKLLAKIIGENYWRKLLAKNVGEKCWRKMLAKNVGENKVKNIFKIKYHFPKYCIQYSIDGTAEQQKKIKKIGIIFKDTAYNIV